MKIPAITMLSILLLGGCGNDVSEDATISILLDTESIDSGCSSANCEDYPMSCGATIMMRLTDADTGEQLYRNGGEEAFFLCIEAAPSNDSLCSLSDLAPQLKLFDVPPKNSRVEVAIFSSDDLPMGCPEFERFELFDALGRPQTNVNPQPAFAGAAYFQLASTRDLVVPLACPNPALLESTTCEANLEISVVATVKDIETVRDIRKNDAPSITVSLGEAREVSDKQGGSFFVLDAADTDDMPLDNAGEIPQYKTEKVLSVGTIVCAATLEDVPEATPSVSCESYSVREDPLKITPVLVGKEILDSVTNALGLGEFPPEGILIGRVVDESFRPIAGARVTPSSGTVFYLSEDLLSVSSSDTSSASGYFVSLDAPFASEWTAIEGAGQIQSGSPTGGLISGKTSALIIRMTGNVIQQ